MSDENDQAYRPDEPSAASLTAAKVFARSENHHLGELELQPFTAERFLIAQTMGLRWPISSSEYRSDGGLYKGEAQDACIVLWLCSLPLRAEKKEAWSLKRAQRDPEKALEESLRWAGEKGVTQPDSKPFWEAMNTYESILVDVVNSYEEPTEKGPANPN